MRHLSRTSKHHDVRPDSQERYQRDADCFFAHAYWWCEWLRGPLVQAWTRRKILWDATQSHNGGAATTALDLLLEMEKYDINANELDEMTSILLVKLAKGIRKGKAGSCLEMGNALRLSTKGVEDPSRVLWAPDQSRVRRMHGTPAANDQGDFTRVKVIGFVAENSHAECNE